MAKPARKTRLLRSLTRAAKAQRSMLATLLDVYAPTPSRPARKAAPRKPAAKPGPARLGLAPATGSWLAGRFPLAATPGQAGARAMQYWLYLPNHRPDRVPDERPRDGWPLVVMLHGCHQSATQFAQGTRMNHLAEDKGFAVLYPQQSVTAQAQRCWRWYDRATQEGGAETEVLASLIGSVCERYPIDRRRIHACGLSAGAGMAAILALNHPELIAAVALHSGPVFGAGHGPVGALRVMRHGAAEQADAAIRGLLQGRPAAPMPPMPALLIQGEDDQVVDPVNQRQLARQWLQLNGLPAGPATRVAIKPAGRGGSRNAHEIHDYLVGRRVVLRVVRIAGLGHAWSGGDPAHAFNAKAGPDASRMVLEFFGRHRR
jgi:poly(hydroxyalkanoate) depolymerase family esterase